MKVEEGRGGRGITTGGTGRPSEVRRQAVEVGKAIGSWKHDPSHRQGRRIRRAGIPRSRFDSGRSGNGPASGTNHGTQRHRTTPTPAAADRPGQAPIERDAATPGGSARSNTGRSGSSRSSAGRSGSSRSGGAFGGIQEWAFEPLQRQSWAFEPLLLGHEGLQGRTLGRRTEQRWREALTMVFQTKGPVDESFTDHEHTRNASRPRGRAPHGMRFELPTLQRGPASRSPMPPSKPSWPPLRTNDTAKAALMLGPESDDVLNSGDPVADRERHRAFVAMYDQAHNVQMTDVGAVLSVGDEDWPLPIPVVQDERGWYFDTEEGLEEILDRRVGRNELATIQVCLAYIDAQREYASVDRDGDGLLEYAQKLRSSQGKKDGLYWPTSARGASEPARQPGSRGVRGGLRPRSHQPGYAPLSRLLLPDPQVPEPLREGRCLRLPRGRLDDRGLCSHRPSCPLRHLGRHDLHRQPRWRGLSRRTWARRPRSAQPPSRSSIRRAGSAPSSSRTD